jgi:pyruvate formate lyase activating enzyme
MVYGTIFDIKKFALHDGPGIRTTVFFKGCPLNCWWCHNPEGRKYEPETFQVKINAAKNDLSYSHKSEMFGRSVTVNDIMKEVLKDEMFYDQSDGGVTFSGGEPMAQIDFLLALLSACKDNNIHTTVDTCGYSDWADFEKICDLVDLFLYDLKLIDDDTHKQYTDVSNKSILDNLTRLTSVSSKVNVRVPLIPGITDSDANLDAMAEHISGLKNLHTVSLLPYNLLGEDKLRRFDLENRLGQLKKQDHDTILQMSKRFMNLGLIVKVGG